MWRYKLPTTCRLTASKLVKRDSLVYVAGHAATLYDVLQWGRDHDLVLDGVLPLNRRLANVFPELEYGLHVISLQTFWYGNSLNRELVGRQLHGYRYVPRALPPLDTARVTLFSHGFYKVMYPGPDRDWILRGVSRANRAAGVAEEAVTETLERLVTVSSRSCQKGSKHVDL